MNKKEIIWSLIAEQELDNIIEYWNSRNQSETYTKSILKNLNTLLNLLSLHPKIGKKSTQRNNVRIKVFMDNFLIIYRSENNSLYILDFWDTRKNPDTNIYL